MINYVAILLTALASHAMTQGYDNEGFTRQQTTCVDVPADLKLCHNVGYTSMVMPNLLKHESLTEVKQQAASFVPLVNSHCHPHVKVFLCSLFAPVCITENPAIKGAIKPCHSLCSAVERSCSPIMRDYTFEWPQMLNCSKYTNQDPCIDLTNPQTPLEEPKPTKPPNTSICAPCRTPLEKETLHDNFCASEFVLKIRSKRYSQDLARGEREITADRKKRVVYKTGPLEKSDLKRMRLIVSGRNCKCPQLESELSGGSGGSGGGGGRRRVPRRARKRKDGKGKKRKRRKSFYLVMGRKVGQKLLVTVLYKWQKKNAVIKQATKTIFAKNTCPEFGMRDDI